MYYADIAERFWEKVGVCPHGWECQECCWPWLGATNTKGYGHFWLRDYGKTKIYVITTRLAWELTHQYVLPPNVLMCHRCDTPLCTQPAHLFPGTHADNTADMHRKKREARGLKHGSQTKPQAFWSMAKITPTIVNELRFLASLGIFNRPELAAAYGLHDAHVGAIVHPNRAWKHLDSYLPVRWKKEKLTAEKVMDIRRRYAAGGIKQKELAQEFGLSENTMGKIITRATWKNLPDADGIIPPMHRKKYNRKLTVEMVKDIRRRYAQGEKVSSLSKAFDVNYSNIKHIVTRHTWKDIADD